VLADSTHLPRRLAAWPGIVFTLVFAWKILLFCLTVQPVPANDAFFYDGPVVNFLLHGQYINPSLQLSFPISGTKVFCAYPPLYQCALLPWMFSFGISAVSAIAFHLVLFGLYMVALFYVLRRLETPTWCIHVAGLFLLLITFHDRPDSLAHLFGILAVYAWVRSGAGSPTGAVPSRAWSWLMATFVVLTLATSLQIGGVYLLLIWLVWIFCWALEMAKARRVGARGPQEAGAARCRPRAPTRRDGRQISEPPTQAHDLFRRERLPVLPMAATVIVPAALVALVVLAFPHLWAGFLEHARQTPSFTGLRRPLFGEFLKVFRTAPGVIAVAIFLPVALVLTPALAPTSTSPAKIRGPVLTLAATPAALAVIVSCLSVLTPNMVAIAGYLQPVIVGSFLAFSTSAVAAPRWKRPLVLFFILLALIGSTRAIGMSTWGLVCAKDFGYSAAIHRVRSELDSAAPGLTVVLSSAYLYEAARHNQVRSIHSDWLHLLEKPRPSESQALLALKPAKLILTQFDFYRRYEPILTELKSRAPNVEFQVIQTAKIPAPDSFPSLQKVVQNISWAPIIVTFDWKGTQH
jgi:hypothetical protein